MENGIKIVTWNCNGAFRKKFESLLEFDADIYVVQECENPKLTKDIEYQNFSINHLWICDTKNKGIGIFAKSNFNLEKLNWSDKLSDVTVENFEKWKHLSDHTSMLIKFET